MQRAALAVTAYRAAADRAEIYAAVLELTETLGYTSLEVAELLDLEVDEVRRLRRAARPSGRSATVETDGSGP